MKNKFILTGLLLLGLAVSLAPSAAAVTFVVDNFESYSGSIPNDIATGWEKNDWGGTFSSAKPLPAMSARVSNRCSSRRTTQRAPLVVT